MQHGDHDCDTLTEREQTMQGCNGPSLQGNIWPLGAGAYSDRCPISRVDQSTVYWINAYFFFTKGWLPNPDKGGYLYQSNVWLEAMLIIERANLAENNKKIRQQEQDIEAARNRSKIG